jgi:hypothetical protein
MKQRLALLGLLAGLCSTTVARAEEPLFGREIVPILYKLGCSTGPCHGSFSGKGGFRLSLFASDPEADYKEVRGILGRRINLQKPEESLILLKPTGKVAHGGGVRLLPGSDEYTLLKRWIEAGVPYSPEGEGKVVSVRVDPPQFLAPMGGSPTSLKVLARLSNGAELDVTRLARFEPFDATIAEVEAGGQVSAQRPGDTHILAHYAGQIGYTFALVPQSLPKGIQFAGEKLNDPVDRLIVGKLKQLNIVPSPLSDDVTFLRRAHLDIIGQLPLPEDIRKFLANTSPNKRAKVIDELLQHPLHAAVWATKLCDITGADNRVLYDRAVCNTHDWYRNKLSANWPWDKIVLGVLSATAMDNRSVEDLNAEVKRLQEERKKQAAAPETKKEKTEPTTEKPWQSGYALRNTLDVFFDNNKFRVQAGPDKGKIDPQPIALHVATAFLGVRLECAECHKHPHDRWSQEDFLGFTLSFAYINRGIDPGLKKKKVNFNGLHVAEEPLAHFAQLVEGKGITPRVLGGTTVALKPGDDPRLEVWKWMVGPDNPYFARSIVNRVWGYYFGKGLIDPVDALSAGNPPSHPEVLDELVNDFVKHKYDLRHLHRRILNTVTYQRSWETNASNAKDERNYSHRLLRRMSAEQVVDAVAQVTGTKVQLAPVYSGDPNRPFDRSIEFPQSRPGGADSYLLKIFDKPQRTQSCDCERAETPNLSQSLFFYNDQALISKITAPEGRLTALLASQPDNSKLLEELYLLTLSRVPTEAERQRGLQYLATSQSRAEGFEDLFWSLLNRREFVVNH